MWFSMLIRFLVLIGYIAGVYYLQRYMRKHPPVYPGEFVFEETRMAQALFRLAGPLLGLALGLLWLYNAPLSPGLLLLLFLFLPALLIFGPWLWHWGVRLSPIYLLFIVFGVLFVGTVVASWWIVMGPLKVTWGVIPMLFFLCAPPVFMLFLLYRWTPEMLPLDAEEQKAHRHDAVKWLMSFLTTFPKGSTVIVTEEAQERIAGNPFLGVGPALLITEPENAAALRDGSKIQDVVGPGTIFIGQGRADVVHSVIDLQNQFRVKRDVEAITRDGIKINVPIASLFRIEGSRPPSQPGEPWQYHKSAAYKALFSAEVNPEGKTPLDAPKARSWKDMPMQAAIHRIKQVVAARSLDEIYTSKGALPEILPRNQMGGAVRAAVAEEMNGRGIEIYGGGMGNVISPADRAVVEQRIESWKTRWMRQIILNQSKVEATYLTQLGRVRSKVLSEMLEILNEQAQKFNGLSKDKIMALLNLRLIEMLEEIARNPQAEPLLPETTFQMLEHLREAHNE